MQRRFPPIRTWLHIPTRQKTNVLKEIINDSYPKKEGFIINGIATIIAVLGYTQDSIPIVIGSMLVATMLYPVIGLGLGITLRHRQLIRISCKSLFTNITISLLFGIFVIIILRFLFDLIITGGRLDTDLADVIRTGFISQSSNLILAMATGLFSGVGAAYILSRKELSTTMAGVAISVALVPPLAKAAIGLSYIDYQWRNTALEPVDYQAILYTGLSEFGLSVSAIILGSAIIFYFMNFDTTSKQVEKQIQKEEKEVQQEKKAAEKARKEREQEKDIDAKQDNTLNNTPSD